MLHRLLIRKPAPGTMHTGSPVNQKYHTARISNAFDRSRYRFRLAALEYSGRDGGMATLTEQQEIGLIVPAARVAAKRTRLRTAERRRSGYRHTRRDQRKAFSL